MRTLIVGCGYLGRRVGRILAGRGEQVCGVVRSRESASQLADWGIECLTADVLRPDTFTAGLDAERILYCVGFNRASGVSMREVYVEGVRRFLTQRSGDARRLVYVSSTGVYGRNDGGWIVEDEPPRPLHEAGQVCFEAEGIARQLGASRGLATIILRSSGLYGPGRIPRRANLMRGEPIVGDPSKFLNLIHVDDAARGAVAALDRGEDGRVYHLSDDRPVSRREFYTLAASLLDAPAPSFEAPVPTSPDSVREDSNKRISNRRLREELGVVPDYPDITSGLPAAIDEERGSLS